MGLLGDIHEVTEPWKRAPWRVKIVLGFSLYLAVSSIASLAESIANWKGFFLTGVQFYQHYLRNPFYSFLTDWLPLSFDETGKDIVTLMSLLTVAVLRVFIFRIKTHKSISKKIIIDEIRNPFVISTTLVFSAFALGNPDLQHNGQNPYLRPLGLASVSHYLLFLVMAIININKGATYLLLLVYLAVPPVVVCIAAAVNLGLRS